MSLIRLKLIQIGRVLENISIAFFAEASVTQLFMLSGARFQSLIPSLMNVLELLAVTLDSTRLRELPDLV